MEREKRVKNYSSWALIREVKPDKDGKKNALKKQCHFIFRQALVPMSIFHSSWVYVRDVQLLIKEIFLAVRSTKGLKQEK